MALTLMHDCPHCSGRNMGFTFVAEARVPGTSSQWVVFFMCNGCHGPVSVGCEFNNLIEPSRRQGNLKELAVFVLCYPAPEESLCPDHLPDGIARAFLQAETAIAQGLWDAAGAMDRRALELATKDKAPEKAADTLYRRIEHLATNGQLTPSLKDWAHDLRVVGNDALHELDGLTKEDASQAHNLTRFILIYLYTLPQQVELAQQAREQPQG